MLAVGAVAAVDGWMCMCLCWLDLCVLTSTGAVLCCIYKTNGTHSDWVELELRPYAFRMTNERRFIDIADDKQTQYLWYNIKFMIDLKIMKITKTWFWTSKIRD